MNAIFTNDTIGFNSLKIKFQFVSVRLQKNILTCSNETMNVNIFKLSVPISIHLMFPIFLLSWPGLIAIYTRRLVVPSSPC